MIFHRISLEAFSHATEDVGRVKRAMLNLVPFEVEDGDFKVERLEGSFGNEIVSLKLEFERQAEIKRALDFVKESLEASDLDIKSHVTDECEFWVRFDKQRAYEGKVERGEHDTVQLKGKVAAFPARREKAIEVMTKAFSKGKAGA